MLKVPEKDRITWEGVFEDPTIKIDEEKMKENMKNILKEKGIQNNMSFKMKSLNQSA